MQNAARTEITELFGEPIHAYTRAQAIEDGMLVDVSEQASAKTGFIGGFTIPVAITAAVHADIERVPALQDYRGRLHDVLWMASLAARRAGQRNETTALYLVYMQVGRTKKQIYKIVIGGGDAGEPVITIMQPNED